MPTAPAPPPAPAPAILPEAFQAWFAGRGWAPRAHQLALLGLAEAGRSALLVAPTGAGKTLAGFLPSLVELSGARHARANRRTLHTLYVSPLKALAVDVARNLEAPAAEMGLSLTIETRTGDTPSHKRARQIARPPDILLTTPEQLALLLAHPDARDLFANLRRIVLDELHALAPSKRGDLLALGLARLFALAPQASAVGLSATVRDPAVLARYLTADATRPAEIVIAPPGAAPDIRMLEGPILPAAGHTAAAAMPEIYRLIRTHGTSLVFVNTRMQAEYVFQALWRLNEDALPIALHHGSLDVEQRRRVEAAMAAGKLKAVVCTSTLDLGIDWGNVDLVINVGAPKGASRIIQRIGRANHRLDDPSKAYLVPANRFEILECRAALDAVEEAAQDTPDPHPGALDVLAQHILGMACAEPFRADDLYAEVHGAAPYRGLDRETFDKAMSFVATGGYALRAYERFARIVEGPDGRWRVRDRFVAQQYRMNVGTIVEATMVKVRLGRPAAAGRPLSRGGRVLGEVEEYFAETLTPGDTFLFAGEVLTFHGLTEDAALVSRASAGTDPKIPSWAGGKFPLSTFLAERVRGFLADRDSWERLPAQLVELLEAQAERSLLPSRDGLLVETFPRAGRHYLVAYPFEGRLAHQTLGMLLTRRLERARLKPLGFVCNDYGLAVWGLRDLSLEEARNPGFLAELFAQDMLGDDLEEWLEESALMKRTFRYCAVIAGLIERNFPGQKKTQRQVTVSTDLVYDVLRRHEPDHVLLRAARADAATGLLDLERLAALLTRMKGRLVHQPLPRVSPLAVSVMLEIGRETVYGEGSDEILAEAEAMLMEEALGG
ncbi:ligase-associated DNA damage response DEXH box helicase [Salinarimonas sp. NSM]|uniref:ligase-associated DNA damage response DEXH box helicase n=1 Tax=Salinarimonas sp. NSM TaxID=3458003 RepID=UPI0040369A3C